MRRERSWLSLLPGLPCLLLLAPSVAAEPDAPPAWYRGKLDFNTGFDYRTGDYGRRDDTDILFVPFSLRYRFQELPAIPERDEFRVRLSIPYLRVKGPERGNASPGSRGTDEGAGDLSLRFTYVHRPDYSDWARTWLPHIYLSQRIKFPTASESKNLGSGEFDFTTDLALRKIIRLRRSPYFRYLKPFVRVGYKVAGEPSGERRDNAWRFGVGSSLAVTRKLDLGLRYSFRESTIPGRGDFEIVSPYLVYRFTDWLRVTPYATFGVSTRSPDWGTGMVIRLTQPIE